MAPPSALLGPPEIHREIHSSTAVTTATEDTISDPFMDTIVKNFNNTGKTRNPPMDFTENCSPTFLTSGNPCLDFFFHVVPDTPPDVLTQRLQLAWVHNPLTTLQLICNLRGVRGTRKSDKEGYYAAAIWLHKHHPKTLSCNVGEMAEFGYFKDLPEILYRLLEGGDVRKKAKQMRKSGTRRVRGIGRHMRRVRPFGNNGNKKEKRTKRKSNSGFRERTIKRAEVEKQKASNARLQKKVAMAKRAIERYSRDPDYKFLYDCVSDFFAEGLKSDIQLLKSGEVRKIGLSAKWCPSLDSSFDLSTLLCESIARKVFPKRIVPIH